MSGRKHGDEKPDVEKLPQRDRGKARDQTGAEGQERHCECGAVLPKGKRLCDQCRIQRRRRTMRDYMRNRRASSLESEPISDMPFPAPARHATHASSHDLSLTDLSPRQGVPVRSRLLYSKNTSEKQSGIWPYPHSDRKHPPPCPPGHGPALLF